MPGKRKVKYSARSAVWPCGDCRKNCSANSVQCDTCNSWYHYHCQQLELADIEFVIQPESSFTCKTCILVEVGDFTFDSSLLRLRLSALRGHQSLKYTASRESLLMPTLPTTDSLPTLASTTEDTVSVMYTQSLGLEIGTPLKATADGNCLFNSVSTLLYGHEHRATELRVRTCIQLCNSVDRYMSRPDARNTLLLSPTLEDACKDCATDNAWSSAWCIMALADVTGLCIKAHYPPMYGKAHLAYQTLNTVYTPAVKTTDQTIAIMWTHTNWGLPGLWNPNHFVPVTDTVTSDHHFQPACHSSPMPSSTEQTTTKVKMEPKSLDPVFDNNEDLPPSLDVSEELPATGFGSDVSDQQPSTADLSDQQPPTADLSDQQPPTADLSDQQPPTMHEDLSEIDEAKEDQQLTLADVHKLQKFHSAREIFKIIIDRKEVAGSCPPGDKSNSWVLVDNTENTLNSDQRNVYFDDCGSWETSKSRTHIQPYLLSDSFKVIWIKNEQYCTRQRIQGKAVFTPIDPQPAPGEVVTMHRYETVLKSNTSFKKHVTWFQSQTDNEMQKTAMYEYIGSYNVSTADKARTNPAVLTKIKADVRKPKEIFLTMNLDNSLEAPRDTKQIKNAKYREKKTTSRPNNNIADDILTVLGMLNDHPYVQQVIHKKNQIPSIICHTDDQMVDFKNFLSRQGGTVGVDRTFNLGHFFVTTLVYKNQRVIKKDTKDNPIFLGPILLHKDASYRTYHSFFVYVAQELKIDNIELRLPQDLSFGSDDEKALTKAIEDAFPSATRRLCTKHLKDNFKHYMQDKVGIDTNERQKLMDTVFGHEGMTNANDTLIFEERSSKVADEMKGYPTLQNYYLKQMKPRIQSFVTAPRMKNKEFDEPLWTNNNSESMNHVFKRAVDWKPQTTPDLVEKLHDCVRIQFLHLRGSLHGHGDYQLIPAQKHYFIPDQVWRCKDPVDKVALYTTFLQDKRRKRTATGMTTSSDGTYSVNTKAQSLAKKPCQRKRATTERARPQR